MTLKSSSPVLLPSAGHDILQQRWLCTDGHFKTCTWRLFSFSSLGQITKHVLPVVLWSWWSEELASGLFSASYHNQLNYALWFITHAIWRLQKSMLHTFPKPESHFCSHKTTRLFHWIVLLSLKWLNFLSTYFFVPHQENQDQLLHRVFGVCRLASIGAGDAFRCHRAGPPALDLRRNLLPGPDLIGCPADHRVHTAPVLHRSGQVRLPGAVFCCVMF